MTIADTAARYADGRPDMTLVDYVEVGLPAWRILARCDVLEPKRISAIDETAMRAISLEVSDPIDLQILLGLDEQILETTLTGLVAREWVRDAGEDGEVAPTDAGQEVLEAASEIVARELVVPFDHDGLLRRPIFDQNLIDRRTGLARGMREVPATPERPPDVAEIRACRQSIAGALRDAGSRREQEAQLLDVRSIDRRDRYMLPAVAMVFAPLGRGRCEVALVIEDELSIEHEAAFVNAGLADRLGLDRRLRATARRPLTLPKPTTGQVELNADAERTARHAIREALERFAVADGEVVQKEAAERLRSARAKLNELPARTVLPHEHEALIRVAVGGSKRRLLIAGGGVTAEHVDGAFIRRLRQTLDSGALVRIVTSGAAIGNEQALDTLRTVARDYSGLVVEERDLGDEGVLVSDDRFAAFGAFPWLGQLGDRERQLTDTRSVLVQDRPAINEIWDRLDGRTSVTQDHVSKPDSGRRRRRHHRRRRGNAEPSG